MPRRKRSSRILEKAERRIASIRSISPTLDLGNGLSVAAYSTLITDLRDQVDTYNTLLSTVDKAYHDLSEIERQVGDYSDHILMGVGVKYGKSSNEYEMAGGARKFERTKRISTDTAIQPG